MIKTIRKAVGIGLVLGLVFTPAVAGATPTLQNNSLNFNAGTGVINAPVITSVSNALGVGGALQLDNTGSGQWTGSSIFDNGQLHVVGSKFVNIDAPVITNVSNALSVGGALQLKNTGSLAYNGSQIYDNGQLHIQGASGTLYVDNATTVAGALTVASGGAAVVGNSTVTGTLSGLTGLTVASGGATVTTGGLTVSAGGAAITGNSTITGTLTGLTGLTVASGGATVTTGGLTVSAGGAAITGNSTITGTLTGLTGLTVASGGLTVTSGAVTVSAGNLAVTGSISATKSITAGYNTVAFSATPTFDASTGNTFKMTLTGNVTSSTISNPTAGQTVTIMLLQDGTGSRTFVWPATVKLSGGTVTLTATANKQDTLTFTYDGTNWFENARALNE